jgi:putative membrane protein
MGSELLTEEDKRAIAEAIHKAEASTSGEIVFAVTDASARYQHATFQGALAGAAIGSGVYMSLPILHNIWFLLWTQAISLTVSYALFLYLPWRRWLIPASEIDARVQNAAFTEFFTSNLHRTREANGVLIYLSCFEKRVVVLGDRGINEKMGTSGWDEVRDRIIKGIHEGKAREGICAAVELCGQTLAQHFPFAAGDTNELSNEVIDRKVRRDAP